MFFKDRKYQRLREGYFALFVAIALNFWERKDHFLQFPKNPDNDINILSIKEIDNKQTQMWKLPCDIREYTKHSSSFDEFIKNIVVPRINTYNIIIGTYLNITDIRPTIESIQNQKQRLTVWIVSSKTPNNDNISNGVVTMIHPNNDILQKEVNLENEIQQTNNNEPVLIFQNLLRDKLI